MGTIFPGLSIILCAKEHTERAAHPPGWANNNAIKGYSLKGLSFFHRTRAQILESVVSLDCKAGAVDGDKYFLFG